MEVISSCRIIERWNGWKTLSFTDGRFFGINANAAIKRTAEKKKTDLGHHRNLQGAFQFVNLICVVV